MYFVLVANLNGRGTLGSRAFDCLGLVCLAYQGSQGTTASTAPRSQGGRRGRASLGTSAPKGFVFGYFRPAAQQMERPRTSKFGNFGHPIQGNISRHHKYSRRHDLTILARSIPDWQTMSKANSTQVESPTTTNAAAMTDYYGFIPLPTGYLTLARLPPSTHAAQQWKS